MQYWPPDGNGGTIVQIFKIQDVGQLHSHSVTPLHRHAATPMHTRRLSVSRSRRQAVTPSFLHMDYTVEYDRLLHRCIRRWTKSPTLDVQTLLHLSHGHALLILIATRRLRAARFLSTHTVTLSPVAPSLLHSTHTPTLRHSVTPVSYTHLTLPTNREV